MNIARLRAIESELRRLQQELTALLAEAEKARDPLVTHIFHSRRRYEDAATRDQSKHQHSVETEIDRSFQAAQQLHFLGTRHNWMTLLRSNQWTAQAMRPYLRGPS